MPIWKRKAQPVVDAAPPVDPAATALGTLPCSSAGCAQTTGIACTYVDRRNRQCTTAWCPAHRMVFDGGVICRRHVGVATALAGVDTPRPDLENRAPSLVEWVADDTAADIARTLHSVCGGRAPDLQAVSTGLDLVFVGIERERVWQRTWKLNQYKGVAYEVSLQVAEEQDSNVLVRVNHNEVARLVPPWIEQRLVGVTVSPTEDAAGRRRFHEEVITAIAIALGEAKPLS
jgi:hypothetical protein